MNPIKSRCPLCNGTGGDLFNNTCQHCRGEGYVTPTIDDVIWWLLVVLIILIIAWLLSGIWHYATWESVRETLI